MAQIIWTRKAFSDLDALILYISKDSHNYARLFVRRIFEIAKNLKDFPQSGRVVPEFGDSSIREILYRDYRIIYHLQETGDIVHILTVTHGAMSMIHLDGLNGEKLI